MTSMQHIRSALRHLHARNPSARGGERQPRRRHRGEHQRHDSIVIGNTPRNRRSKHHGSEKKRSFGFDMVDSGQRAPEKRGNSTSPRWRERFDSTSPHAVGNRSRRPRSPPSDSSDSDSSHSSSSSSSPSGSSSSQRGRRRRDDRSARDGRRRDREYSRDRGYKRNGDYRRDDSYSRDERRGLPRDERDKNSRGRAYDRSRGDRRKDNKLDSRRRDGRQDRHHHGRDDKYDDSRRGYDDRRDDRRGDDRRGYDDGRDDRRGDREDSTRDGRRNHDYRDRRNYEESSHRRGNGHDYYREHSGDRQRSPAGRGADRDRDADGRYRRASPRGFYDYRPNHGRSPPSKEGRQAQRDNYGRGSRDRRGRQDAIADNRGDGRRGRGDGYQQDAPRYDSRGYDKPYSRDRFDSSRRIDSHISPPAAARDHSSEVKRWQPRRDYPASSRPPVRPYRYADKESEPSSRVATRDQSRNQPPWELKAQGGAGSPAGSGRDPRYDLDTAYPRYPPTRISQVYGSSPPAQENASRAKPALTSYEYGRRLGEAPLKGQPGAQETAVVRHHPPPKETKAPSMASAVDHEDRLQDALFTMNNAVPEPTAARYKNSISAHATHRNPDMNPLIDQSSPLNLPRGQKSVHSGTAEGTRPRFGRRGGGAAHGAASQLEFAVAHYLTSDGCELLGRLSGEAREALKKGVKGHGRSGSLLGEYLGRKRVLLGGIGESKEGLVVGSEPAARDSISFNAFPNSLIEKNEVGLLYDLCLQFLGGKQPASRVVHSIGTRSLPSGAPLGLAGSLIYKEQNRADRLTALLRCVMAMSEFEDFLRAYLNDELFCRCIKDLDTADQVWMECLKRCDIIYDKFLADHPELLVPPARLRGNPNVDQDGPFRAVFASKRRFLSSFLPWHAARAKQQMLSHGGEGGAGGTATGFDSTGMPVGHLPKSQDAGASPGAGEGSVIECVNPDWEEERRLVTKGLLGAADPVTLFKHLTLLNRVGRKFATLYQLFSAVRRVYVDQVHITRAMYGQLVTYAMGWDMQALFQERTPHFYHNYHLPGTVVYQTDHNGNAFDERSPLAAAPRSLMPPRALQLMTTLPDFSYAGGDLHRFYQATVRMYRHHITQSLMLQLPRSEGGVLAFLRASAERDIHGTGMTELKSMVGAARGGDLCWHPNPPLTADIPSVSDSKLLAPPGSDGSDDARQIQSLPVPIAPEYGHVVRPSVYDVQACVVVAGGVSSCKYHMLRLWKVGRWFRSWVHLARAIRLAIQTGCYVTQEHAKHVGVTLALDQRLIGVVMSDFLKKLRADTVLRSPGWLVALRGRAEESVQSLPDHTSSSSTALTHSNPRRAGGHGRRDAMSLIPRSVGNTGGVRRFIRLFCMSYHPGHVDMDGTVVPLLLDFLAMARENARQAKTSTFLNTRGASIYEKDIRKPQLLKAPDNSSPMPVYCDIPPPETTQAQPIADLPARYPISAPGLCLLLPTASEPHSAQAGFATNCLGVTNAELQELLETACDASAAGGVAGLMVHLNRFVQTHRSVENLSSLRRAIERSLKEDEEGPVMASPSFLSWGVVGQKPSAMLQSREGRWSGLEERKDSEGRSPSPVLVRSRAQTSPKVGLRSLVRGSQAQPSTETALSTRIALGGLPQVRVYAPVVAIQSVAEFLAREQILSPKCRLLNGLALNDSVVAQSSLSMQANLRQSLMSEAFIDRCVYLAGGLTNMMVRLHAVAASLRKVSSKLAVMARGSTREDLSLFVPNYLCASRDFLSSVGLDDAPFALERMDLSRRFVHPRFPRDHVPGTDMVLTYHWTNAVSQRENRAHDYVAGQWDASLYAVGRTGLGDFRDLLWLLLGDVIVERVKAESQQPKQLPAPTAQPTQQVETNMENAPSTAQPIQQAETIMENVPSTAQPIQQVETREDSVPSTPPPAARSSTTDLQSPRKSVELSQGAFVATADSKQATDMSNPSPQEPSSVLSLAEFRKGEANADEQTVSETETETEFEHPEDSVHILKAPVPESQRVELPKPSNLMGTNGSPRPDPRDLMISVQSAESTEAESPRRSSMPKSAASEDNDPEDGPMETMVDRTVERGSSLDASSVPEEAGDGTPNHRRGGGSQDLLSSGDMSEPNLLSEATLMDRIAREGSESTEFGIMPTLREAGRHVSPFTEAVQVDRGAKDAARRGTSLGSSQDLTGRATPVHVLGTIRDFLTDSSCNIWQEDVKELPELSDKALQPLLLHIGGDDPVKVLSAADELCVISPHRRCRTVEDVANLVVHVEMEQGDYNTAEGIEDAILMMPHTNPSLHEDGSPKRPRPPPEDTGPKDQLLRTAREHLHEFLKPDHELCMLFEPVPSPPDSSFVERFNQAVRHQFEQPLLPSEEEKAQWEGLRNQMVDWKFDDPEAELFWRDCGGTVGKYSRVILHMRWLGMVGRRFTELDQLKKGVVDSESSGSHLSDGARAALIEYLGSPRFTIMPSDVDLHIGEDCLDYLVASAGSPALAVYHMEQMGEVGRCFTDFNDVVRAVSVASQGGGYVGQHNRDSIIDFLEENHDDKKELSLLPDGVRGGIEEKNGFKDVDKMVLVCRGVERCLFHLQMMSRVGRIFGSFLELSEAVEVCARQKFHVAEFDARSIAHHLKKYGVLRNAVVTGADCDKLVLLCSGGIRGVLKRIKMMGRVGRSFSTPEELLDAWKEVDARKYHIAPEEVDQLRAMLLERSLLDLGEVDPEHAAEVVADSVTARQLDLFALRRMKLVERDDPPPSVEDVLDKLQHKHAGHKFESFVELVDAVGTLHDRPDAPPTSRAALHKVSFKPSSQPDILDEKLDLVTDDEEEETSASESAVNAHNTTEAPDYTEETPPWTAAAPTGEGSSTMYGSGPASSGPMPTGDGPASPIASAAASEVVERKLSGMVRDVDSSRGSSGSLDLTPLSATAALSADPLPSPPSQRDSTLSAELSAEASGSRSGSRSDSRKRRKRKSRRRKTASRSTSRKSSSRSTSRKSRRRRDKRPDITSATSGGPASESEGPVGEEFEREMEEMLGQSVDMEASVEQLLQVQTTVDERGRDVHAKVPFGSHLLFDFSGSDLPVADYKSSDPFLELNRMKRYEKDCSKDLWARLKDNNFEGTHKTEYKGSNLNPHWRPFFMSADDLCREELDRPVKLKIYDWNIIDAPDFMCDADTSLRGLFEVSKSGQMVPLKGDGIKKKKHPGLFVHLCELYMRRHPDLLNAVINAISSCDLHKELHPSPPTVSRGQDPQDYAYYFSQFPLASENKSQAVSTCASMTDGVGCINGVAVGVEHESKCKLELTVELNYVKPETQLHVRIYRLDRLKRSPSDLGELFASQRNTKNRRQTGFPGTGTNASDSVAGIRVQESADLTANVTNFHAINFLVEPESHNNNKDFPSPRPPTGSSFPRYGENPAHYSYTWRLAVDCEPVTTLRKQTRVALPAVIENVYDICRGDYTRPLLVRVVNKKGGLLGMMQTNLRDLIVARGKAFDICLDPLVPVVKKKRHNVNMCIAARVMTSRRVVGRDFVVWKKLREVMQSRSVFRFHMVMGLASKRGKRSKRLADRASLRRFDKMGMLSSVRTRDAFLLGSRRHKKKKKGGAGTRSVRNKSHKGLRGTVNLKAQLLNSMRFTKGRGGGGNPLLDSALAMEATASRRKKRKTKKKKKSA